MMKLTGKAWGRFQIKEERGRGGMAVLSGSWATDEDPAE